MKKVIVTLVLVLVTSFSYGQKLAEKRAKENTKEMVKVLSLDANEEAQVYEVNLEKNTKLMANDKLESKEEKKANRKVIYVAAGKKFKEIVGFERMKEWWAYKEAQSAAKK
jgi:hypothetical protein